MSDYQGRHRSSQRGYLDENGVPIIGQSVPRVQCAGCKQWFDEPFPAHVMSTAAGSVIACEGSPRR